MLNKSITKTKLSKEEIIKLTQQAFGKYVGVKKITELTDGFFNTAYVVEFKDKQRTVLKVSPRENIEVMRYEKNIMETEVLVLNEVYRSKSIPVPKVLYYDKSKNVIDSQFFFMEFISGDPLDKMQGEFTEEEYFSIYSKLGENVKKINSIESNYFGYISQEDKKFSSWAEAFLNMIKELLNDASEIGISLPVKDDKLYNLISAQKHLLNKVKTPVLVHKDLWAGNIFVDPKSAEITGIVDWERALFGDGLLDIVCGFLLDNKTFIESYLGRDSLTKDEEIRCSLYKIYLYLIMIIESDYRKYQEQKIKNWARSELDKTVNDLKIKI